jgi:hypothetical protein
VSTSKKTAIVMVSTKRPNDPAVVRAAIEAAGWTVREPDENSSYGGLTILRILTEPENVDRALREIKAISGVSTVALSGYKDATEDEAAPAA